MSCKSAVRPRHWIAYIGLVERRQIAGLLRRAMANARECGIN
jgi:hypothetical protein